MSLTRTCSSCGFSGECATAALGDAHHQRHSCAEYRRTVEQARRRAERVKGRIRRDCNHPGAAHVHGTRAAYVKDRCRCTDCTAANTAASQAMHRAQTFGRWHPFTDAGPIREHIRALRAAGIGVEQIATLAGIATSHVRQLAATDGGTPAIRRVRPDTARRILNIGIDQTNRAPRSRVDATGTRRRLQALIAIGWTQAQLATHLGRDTAGLRRSMASDAVTVQTASEVHALYQRLWNIHPPRDTEAQRTAADAARTYAADHGWLPPLAWDDIDTDPEPVPHTEPPPDDEIDQIAIERAIAGDGIRLNHLTPAEQDLVIRHLTERGRSIRDIARQLATTKRTVSRRRASLRAP